MMKINEKILFLSRILMVLLFVTISGGSMVQAEQSTEVAPDAAIEGLIKRLEDVDDRQRLVDDLKTLQQAINKTQAEKSVEAPNVLSGVLENLAGHLAAAGDSITSISQQAGDPTDIIEWASAQVANADRRALWLSVLLHVVLVAGAALGVAWLMGQLLKRPKVYLESRGISAWYARAPLLLGRTVLDLLPLAGLMVTAYAALAFSGPDHLVYGIVLSVVHALVAVRFLTAIAKSLVTPFSTSLRLFVLADETAAYIFIWLKRLIKIPVYGFFAAQIAFTLGLPSGAYAAVIKLVGLTETVLLLVLILQLKDAVAGSLATSGETASDKASGALSGVRKRIAEVWHHFAGLYVISAFIIWALEIEGGFAFVATGTVGTVIVIALASGARLLANGGLKRLFSISDQMKRRYPVLEVRANKYLPAARRIVSGLIWLIAVLLVLRAWQFDVGAWLVSDFGRLIVSRGLNIILILGLALAVWEGISTLITVYLEKTDNDGHQVERSARVRTLLPLARNALLVVILTMAILTTLSELGVNIGPLLAGAGVIGLAIGFGAQTLVKDIITGAFILIEDSIALGDFVTVGGLSGTVETMTIRTIRLRDSRGTVHTVPFSSVDTVTNKTKDFAYHVAEVGVAYRENIDEVYDALRDIGAELQADAAYGSDILEPITIDGVDALADSAVVVRARLKTRPGSQWRIKRIFNDLVKRRFDERGIEIPYPHQTIYFGEDKKGGAPALQIKAADKQAIAEAFTQTKTPKAGAENKPLAVDRHHRDANDDGSDGGDGGGV
ncbi:MAG: mechanosensitive ion channel [Alphaproteobacteria bacterium]|jgi:moderate conductance mechanosensitive channel|nr:mechanosensitive ion channel [Alphaproteobacteria bacterium]MBT6387299.1 mechanosensitive ion channel [Alphaproteobacteria bacterium]